MALTVGRTKLLAHPLALLMPVLALALGAGSEALALTIGLAAHEAAHLLAARALGVGVSQLRLMPFGGAISLENPYAIAPGKLLAVAAAGPAGSLLCLILSAALAHWRALSPGLSLALIQANLVLMLFNLVPALPLDGGRMLYALLCERLGRAKAAELGILLGRITAAMLAGLALAMAILHRRVNLSLLFAAAFLLASAGDERRALSGADLRALLGTLKPVAQPMPARMVAVGEDCAARAALRAARADALTLYAVYSGSRLVRLTDDRRLLEALIAGGADARVGDA